MGKARHFASRGYAYIYSPLRRKFAPEHIVVAETALGKLLKKPAEVHHFDEVITNNCNSNLVVCNDRSYHQLLHRRSRAAKVCGNANFRRCMFCKVYSDPVTMVTHGKSISHLECRKSYQHAYYRKNPEIFAQRRENTRPKDVVSVQKILGKELPRQVRIYHVDHKKTNNTNTNLVVCQDRAYHCLIYQRSRAFLACGNASYRKCHHCTVYGDPKTMRPIAGGAFSHWDCSRMYARELYKNSGSK